MEHVRPSAKNHFPRHARVRRGGVLIYCSDYRCSHHIAIRGIGGPMMFACLILSRPVVCNACGKRGAEVRPDFNRTSHKTVSNN
jgi:hypothetical protein